MTGSHLTLLMYIKAREWHLARPGRSLGSVCMSAQTSHKW